MRIQTIRASNYLNLRARVIEIPGTANAVVIASYTFVDAAGALGLPSVRAFSK